MNGEKFIEKANYIYNHKYNYDLVFYKNNRTNVKIICPEHGIFEQSPDTHINIKRGCVLCNKEKKEKLRKEKMIIGFNKIHNNEYDYSLMKYINPKTNIKIICPLHGIFIQNPYNHLKGQKCPKCQNHFMDTEYFIQKAIIKHNNTYNYDKVIYDKTNKKIIINCNIHGDFEVSPSKHLNGQGCLMCSKEEKINIKQNIFIEKSKSLHNNKYNYSLVRYKTSISKVKIICPIHGVFEQKPNDHMIGKGCKKCKQSKGERKISIYLNQRNIKFISEYKFNDCKNILPLPFDFYLHKYNLCIEYDGIQHFEASDFFGGEITFKQRIKNDKIKNDFCNKNNINLLRIKYNENINKILEDFFSQKK